MNRLPRAVFVMTAIALAIGLAEPPLEVAWKCRQGFETSEACVWGRSLLPLGRAVGLVLIAPVSFGLLFLARWAWNARVGRWRPGEIRRPE